MSDRTCESIPAPANPICGLCDEQIYVYEPQSFTHLPTHWECGLRALVGGINHQRGKCSCHGGKEDPDPPGLSRREAAKAAADYFMANRK